MGNMGSRGSRGSSNRRRRGSRRSNPPPAAPPEAAANRYVVTTAPSPAGQYYHYPGYFPAPAPGPAMPVLPAPYDQHHRGGHVEGGDWVGGRYPPPPPPAAPYVEHQKAVTIRNDVNLKKESLRVEADVDDPGKVLVCFTFDATVEGSISIIFFAKEGEDCNLTPAKESQIPALTVQFQQGLGQKFRQASGTGIDLAAFEEAELLRAGDSEVYPLAVKAEASLEPAAGPANSQITLAVFEKDKGGFRLRVAKQILWVNGMRYELQEIYGIGNSVEGDVEGNDPGKECVICLSEPRDTTVLPCRHMCMCSECAKVLRFQTNRCPICRQPVERLLEIRVNSGPEE